MMERQPVLRSSAHHYGAFHDGSSSSSSNFAAASYQRTLHLPFRPEIPASLHNAAHRYPRRPPPVVTMAATDDDLAQFQKLSNEYEPEATGPLVSDRLSTSNITTEYANGDPIFQAKTAKLPQKFSHYRTCRGDGHCGWRAIAFCYFEALLRTGDRNKYLEEETRLRSLANILKAVGFQEHTYEDFADDTVELLRDGTAAALNNAGDGSLLAAFNDTHRSASIITYFKLLASAYLQTHADEYEPFTQPLSIGQYCRERIEPALCEIEHVGMTALIEVLVKPAGFAVEVMYLDRSPGDQVNIHRFDPLDYQGILISNPPTLRLLYRPGHYDILYRAEEVPRQPLASASHTQPPVLVHLASQAEDHGILQPIMGSNYEIPGNSLLNAPDLGFSYPGYHDFSSITAMHPQAIRTTSTPAYSSASLSVPASAHSDDFYLPNVPADHNFNLPGGVHAHQPVSIDRNGPFRPSMWEFEPNYTSGPTHNTPFQTSIFRNSHYNTAHFNNPDFEPEQWSPEAEYSANEKSRKRAFQ